jgi:choline dehydrogenase-like flavoprotein
MRPPRALLSYWERAFALPGLGHEAFLPHVRKVETQIGVRRVTQEQVNPNGQRLMAGSQRLGYRGHLPFHNRHDCVGAGFCELGCTYDRKGDMLTTYLPAASRAGAVIIPDCRVDRVLAERGRATGVTGVFNRTRSGKAHALRVRAKMVVLAAGAINSPRLWVESGLPDPSEQVGRNLRLHPTVVVSALYSEPIRAWEGIPQAWVVDEFLSIGKQDAGTGYLMIPASAHPVAAASLLPGYGAAHRELMLRYARLGGIGVVVHDHSRGRLEFDAAGGPPTVAYRLGTTDEEQLLDGMTKAAEISFAAGAEQVFLPYNETVAVNRRDAAAAIRQRGIRANDPLFLSLHPQGTLRMGGDPKRAVVNAFGEAHAVRGLFVCDASVFPKSVGVAPQVTVMALATRSAQHVLAEARKYFTADARG